MFIHSLNSLLSLFHSDPYSRKRAIDPYEDTSDVGIRPVPLMRLDYDDFRPSAAVPAKKER